MMSNIPVVASRDDRRALSEDQPDGWKRGPETTDGARLWTMAAGDGERIFAVREPAVARAPGASASPLFSLTLTLERQPTPDEASLLPLVRGGALSITLDVTPSDAELSAAFPEHTPSALFMRGVKLAFVRTKDQTRIAEAAIGFGGRVALRPTLGTDDAVTFLRALRGDACGVALVAEIAYQPPAPPPPAVTLDVLEVYDFLARRAADDRTFVEIDLVNYFGAMIEGEIVQVRDRTYDATTDARTHLRALLDACKTILVPVRDVVQRYQLLDRPRARPRAADLPAQEMLTLVLARPLEAVLAPLARRYSTDALIVAVSPSRDGGFERIGPRIEVTRDVGTPRPLASFGSEALSMTVALRTGRAGRVSAAALAHSGLVVRPHGLTQWVLDDVVHTPSNNPAPMPQIDEPAAPMWSDRVDAKRYWYAPDVTIVMPTPLDTPSASPFLFSFRTVGHDASGRPGLEATIRVRLRFTMPAATEAAWTAAGKPTIQPVPLGGLAVSLEIPFRDAAGQTQVQAIKASAVTPNGADHDATFVLTDAWARLAYGALAFDDFQDRPIRLVASWVFSAAVRSARATDGLARHVPAMGVMRARPIVPAANTIRFTHTIRPNQAVPLPNESLPHVPPGLLLPLAPRLWITQTQGRTARVDVLLPCATFGAFYMQTDGASVKPVGCQNAFALGVVELKLFEPLALDFGGVTPPFQVLRSLQVPGRFLVLPTAYTVARFEPGDSRGYRPALFLFANVDTDRDRTRCVVTATLEPAVSAYWRDALLAKLETTVHTSPELVWPSDLDVVPTFSWALTASGPTAVEANTVATPEGFQVSLSTGVDGVLLLEGIIERSGVMGSVTFPLPDGTSLRSSLAVDLARVSGPFVAGPIEIELAGTKAKLTNRIEQPVDVAALGARASGARKVIPVEKRLAAGASTIVDVPAGAQQLTADATPVGGPTSFEEIRTYVEDIYVSAEFVTAIDFAGIASLGIEVAIVGVPGSVRAVLSPETPRADVTLLLPLTTYVAQPTLRFTVTRTPREGAPVTSPWREWRLDTLGSVVEIHKSELP